MPSHQCLALACCLEMFLACAVAQVDVAIAASKTVYVVGEPVFITVRITNTSTSPLTIVVPPPDSCLSGIDVAIAGVRRSDLPPCPDPKTISCAYDGPPAKLVEVKPQTSYDMRRLVNLIYELDRPREYSAHMAFSLLYTEQPVLEYPASFRRPDYRHSNYEKDLTFAVVEGDANALKAAFAPVVADLESEDFARQWYAQLVLLNLAPPFAEDRILRWADRADLEQEAMAALRKLGTRRAIEKLEATAFEKPSRNDQREGMRQAALSEIKNINDPSLLPKLFEITAGDRGQSIRWAAASAAARIGHGDAVPIIARMLASSDPNIAFAGSEALGDTSSRDAVPILICAIPSALEDNKLPAIVEALARLTHRTTPGDPAARVAIYRKWSAWWSVNHGDAEIYDPDDCGTITKLP
ncbi:MAG: HEAT repeat domain-containing protein [Candidatus Sulfotelmatobacter sp.]